MTQREIKFRAWNNHYDKDQMFSWKQLIKQYAHLDTVFNTSEWDCMQYTNYRDLDGNEIYFNDLVSNNFGTGKEVIRKIVMQKGCIMVKRVKGKSSSPKFILIQELRKWNFIVVGNIYENPELLK